MDDSVKREAGNLFMDGEGLEIDPRFAEQFQTIANLWGKYQALLQQQGHTHVEITSGAAATLTLAHVMYARFPKSTF